MPGRNRYPVLGGHVETELAEWVRGEAKRRGVTITVILEEAIKAYRQLLPPWWWNPPDSGRNQS